MAMPNVELENRAEEIPLPLVCQRARVRWSVAWLDILSGGLPATKRGGRWLVPRAAAEEYIARRRGEEGQSAHA